MSISTEQKAGARRRRWRNHPLLRDHATVVGLTVMLSIVIVAVAAPRLPLPDPTEQAIALRLQPPEATGHALGTDDFGRDMLSRIVWGARVSLTVGVAAVLLGMAIGVPLGLVAGYKGGWIDSSLMRGIDIMMSFPSLLLGMMILALLGAGLVKMVIAIGVSMIPQFARLARAPTVALREREFIEAGRAIGLGEWRLMFKHVLPNIAGELVVMGTVWTATAIRTEANLSFIGLGIPPPNPSWGGMIREGLNFLGTAPWMILGPGLAIFLTVLCFNIIGDGLRDWLDPKSQK